MADYSSSSSNGPQGATAPGLTTAEAAEDVTFGKENYDLKKWLGAGKPLGKYQGFIFLGLGVGCIAIAGTKFGPAVAAILGVLFVSELTFAVQNKLAIEVHGYTAAS